MTFKKVLAVSVLAMVFALSFLAEVVDDPHEQATHLLDESTFVDTVKKENHARVVEIRKVIEKDSKVLHTQLKELQKLRRETLAIKEKKGHLWFMDAPTRLAVRASEIKVNDQEREVQNTLDDISLQWATMKPLYGVRSQMFVAEMLASLLSLISRVFGSIIPPVSVSLVSLFVFGPVAGFLVWLWLLVGWLLLPLTAAVLGLVYLVEAPSVILQYAPSAGEFAVAYGAAVLTIFFTVRLLGWLTAPYVTIDAGNWQRVKVD